MRFLNIGGTNAEPRFVRRFLPNNIFYTHAGKRAEDARFYDKSFW